MHGMRRSSWPCIFPQKFINWEKLWFFRTNICSVTVMFVHLFDKEEKGLKFSCSVLAKGRQGVMQETVSVCQYWRPTLYVVGYQLICPETLLGAAQGDLSTSSHSVSNTKEFLCITLTVEHNYISSSSTVGINYMFLPYMWAIFRLLFNLQSNYTRCVACFLGVLGVG